MSAATRVGVGVRYCVNHHGVANEDDHRCDFADTDRDAPRDEADEPICDFRDLFYEEVSA